MIKMKNLIRGNSNILHVMYLTYFSLVVLFGRSFTGIYLFEFRLGELMIASAVLLSVIILILPLSSRNIILGKENLITHKLIILSFITTFFLTGGNVSNTYTFQSSSYVWTYSFLFLSYVILKNYKINKKTVYLVALFLPALYILSTIHFPDFLIQFFVNYSDRFDFVKASDLLVVFVASNYFMSLVFKNKRQDFIYFLFSSAVYLPYLLFKSKGAFLPAVIFIFFNLIYFFKFIKTNKVFSSSVVLFSALLFLISTFHIYGNFNFKKEGQDNFQNVSISDPSSVVDNLSKLVNEKNTAQIFASFYVLEGRLYSQEQMADWRLQIWQDITRDIFWNADYSSNSKGNVIRKQGDFRTDMFYKGFGYNEILPAMNFAERQGTDGTNQNPHNFLIYALGRGGLFNLIFVIMFHVTIFLYFYKKNNDLKILLFILPVLMTSFFDASMESVRFPFVYYTFLALFLNFYENHKKNKDTNIF